MDMKIGEVREFEGKKYRCVEGNCSKCAFNNKSYTCEMQYFNLGECGRKNRKDGKSVIFVEVKE